MWQRYHQQLLAQCLSYRPPDGYTFHDVEEEYVVDPQTGELLLLLLLPHANGNFGRNVMSVLKNIHELTVPASPAD